MNSYLLNKSSGILHRLPASESCNTDQIHKSLRFEIHASEEVVGHLGSKVKRLIYCKRCFDADRP